MLFLAISEHSPNMSPTQHYWIRFYLPSKYIHIHILFGVQAKSAYVPLMYITLNVHTFWHRVRYARIVQYCEKRLNECVSIKLETVRLKLRSNRFLKNVMIVKVLIEVFFSQTCGRLKNDTKYPSISK